MPLAATGWQPDTVAQGVCEVAASRSQHRPARGIGVSDGEQQMIFSATFPQVSGRRSFWLPTGLGRLPVTQAVATVVLPLHLNWSLPRRTFRLADRAQRARAYEIVLREGSPDELAAYVDGALLVELWPELVLPREIRAAWTPVIAAATDTVEDS